MSKKQKIKELLDRLNTLDGSFLTPSEEELSDLTNKIITDEISNVTVKLKENTTIKSLERIATELNKIKKNFDLKPIISTIKELDDQIKIEQKNLISDF